jgi:hypothetical protein
MQGQTPTFFSSQSLQKSAMADKQLVPFSFEAKEVVPFEKKAEPLASLPPDHNPLSLFPLSRPHSPPPPMLMVFTTKFRPSKPQVQEEYTTSFMHIFYTNKVPRVVLQFLWTGTHLGGKWNQRATRARHDRTTRHGWPCRCGRPGRCGRTCSVPRPRSQSSLSLRAQLG